MSDSPTANRYIAITTLDGRLYVIMLYEKPSSPQLSRPTEKRSFSIESEGIHPSLATLEHDRCAVGVAQLDGKLIAAGKVNVVVGWGGLGLWVVLWYYLVPISAVRVPRWTHGNVWQVVALLPCIKYMHVTHVQCMHAHTRDHRAKSKMAVPIATFLTLI